MYIYVDRKPQSAETSANRRNLLFSVHSSPWSYNPQLSCSIQQCAFPHWFPTASPLVPHFDVRCNGRPGWWWCCSGLSTLTLILLHHARPGQTTSIIYIYISLKNRYSIMDWNILKSLTRIIYLHKRRIYIMYPLVHQLLFFLCWMQRRHSPASMSIRFSP